MKHLTKLAIFAASVLTGNLLLGQVPDIAKQPQSTNVAIGNSFTLEVVVSSGTNLLYQWQLESAPIVGATNDTYTVSGAQATNSGNYRVMVTNTISGIGTNSTTAVVNVVEAPSNLAVSGATTNGVGTPMTLYASASGDATLQVLQYQWYRGTNLAQAFSTFNSLNVLGNTNNSGGYTVVVSNAVGVATSAVVQVEFVPAPVISNLSANLYIPSGTDYSITPSITGKYLSYQWWQSNSAWYSRLDDTNASLLLNAVNSSDNGYYAVAASNVWGVVSNITRVYVYDVPVIVTNPAATSDLAYGSNLTLSAVATGGGNLSFTWTFGTNVITTSSFTNAAFATVTNGDGSISNGLTLSNMTLAGAGTYTVTVTNEVGKTNSAGTVVRVVRAPEFTTDLSGGTNYVSLGSNYTFTVQLSNGASSLLTYIWSTNTGTNALVPIAGAVNTNTYTISSAAKAVSNFTYSVLVSNVAGTRWSKTNTLIVLAPASATPITATNGSLVVGVGTNVDLLANASGDLLQYQWYNGTNLLAGQTATNYSVPSAIIGVQGSNTYSVAISNNINSISRSNVTLTFVVGPASVSNTITWPTNTSAPLGGSASFRVVCTNALLLSYQWYYTNGTTNSVITNAVTSALAISGMAASNVGSYYVVLSNAAGVLTSTPAALVLQTTPVPTISPSGTAYRGEGTNLVLSASASGNPTFYQWAKDGAIISGSNATTLGIVPAQSNSGNYTIIATNGAGSVTSAPTAVWFVPSPVIVTNPSTAGVFLGDDHTLTVSIENPTNAFLSYQWYYTNNTGLPNTNTATNILSSTNNLLPGQTLESLLINGAGYGDSGDYVVVVSNVAGCATSTVASVRVQVPPTFTTQPVVSPSPVVASNGNFTITVRTSGDDLTYQWWNGTNSISSGAASFPGGNTLTVNGAQTANFGSYWVTASNLVGVATSTNVQVYMSGQPVIAVEPVGSTVVQGSSYTFSVTVTNIDSSLLSYQWYSAINGVTNSIAGATLSSYTLNGVAAIYDSGDYWVVVSVADTNVPTTASAHASLVILAIPSILTQPTNTSVVLGSTTNLFVRAVGGNLNYFWFKDSVALTNNSPTLAISNASLANAGNYYVVVSNSLGSVTSSNATVLVEQKPGFKTLPTGSTNLLGSEVILRAVISTTAPSLLRYQWYFSTNQAFTSPVAVGVGEVTTNATYSTNILDITACSMTNDGWYNLLVTNDAGAISNTPVRMAVQSYPQILSQLTNVSAAESTSVTLIANTSGESLRYIWYKEGVQIGVSDTNGYTITNGVLTNCGLYSFTVSNDVGVLNSTSARIMFLSTPVFTTNLATNVLAVVGGFDTTLSVTVSNVDVLAPALSYQWAYKSTNVGAAFTNLVNATNSDYTVRGAAAKDIGYYKVLVTAGPTNLSLSASSSNALVSVDFVPTISVQPVGTNVMTNGAGVVLSVTAAGNDLYYQWKLAGAAITDATNATYTVTAATPASNLVYSVLVSNLAGTITSSNATINIVKRQSITGPAPASTNVAQYTDCTFTASVADSTLLSYQWYKGPGTSGTAIAGATNASLSIYSSGLSDSTNYFLITSSSVAAVGSVTSSVSTLVVETAPRFISQPLSTNVGIGTNISTLNVSDAAGSALSYKWYKIGLDGTTNVVAGATSFSYDVASPVTNDSGSYYVVITNDVGSATSAIATVYVVGVPASVAVVSDPTNATIASGNSVVFTATVPYLPLGALSYQWYWNNANSALFNDTNVLVGEIRNTLEYGDMDTNFTGYYYVRVTDAAGVANSGLTNLVVMDAPTTFSTNAQPQVGSNQFVQLNQTLELISHATNASDPITYYWYLDDGTNVSLLTTNSTGNYLDAAVATTNTGNYYVIVSNAVGTLRSANVLITVESPVTTTRTLYTNYIPAGGITLSAPAAGGNLYYYWSNITSATLQGTTPTVTLSGLAAGSSNCYVAMITNDVDSVGVLVTNIVIVEANAAVSVISVTNLTTTILMGGTKAVVAKGDSIALQVTNTGNVAGDNVTNTWYLNGIVMGSGTNLLAYTSASVTNNGTFQVKSANDRSTNWSPTFVLQVVATPSFLQQPAGGTVIANSHTPFTLTAKMVNAENSALSYEWHMTNAAGAQVALSGVTNSTNYVISNPQTANDGWYYVVVTNVAGAVSNTPVRLYVQDVPSWGDQPTAPATVGVGSNIVLTAKALGQGLGYRWTNLTTGWFAGTGTTAGNGTNTLTLPGAAISNSGMYYVAVTNVLYTSNLITTQLVSTPVQVLVVERPTFIMNGDLSDRFSIVGSNIQLKVTMSNAASSDLTYLWYKADASDTSMNTAAANLVQSNTINSYAPVVATAWASNIFVVITNAAGSATSAVAMVRIEALPALTNATGAGVVTIGVGGSATLTYTNYTGGSTLAYQWYSNHIAISGQTGPSLTKSSATTNDTADYYAVITNEVGTATGQAIHLNVLDVPVINDDGQPVDGVVKLGSNYTFSVTVASPDPSLVTYQWYTNNIADISATSSSYRLPAVKLSDSLVTYKVVVTDIAGSTPSRGAKLRVMSTPVVITNLANYQTNVDVSAPTNGAFWGPIVLRVAITNGVNLNYTWYKSNAPVTLDARMSIVSDDTNSILTISNPVVSDSGPYNVNVSNAYGGTNSAICQVLVVTVPEISIQPKGTTNKAETAYTLVVQPTAASKALTYQWQMYDQVSAFTNLDSGTNATYRFLSLTTTNTGAYRVVISNMAGTITSSNAVVAVETNPVVITSPVSTNIVVGSNLNLSVTAQGASTLSYRWKWKPVGGAVTNLGTDTTLTKTSARLADSGQYWVVVSNVLGQTATSSTSTVWVVDVPVITKAPISTYAAKGSNYTLSVTAANAYQQALSYQWYYSTNSNPATATYYPITGATTNYLALTNLDLTNTAYYGVVITNVAGAVSNYSTSNMGALLTILDRPTITGLSADPGLTVGSNAQLNVTVTASGGNLGFAWKKSSAIVRAGRGTNIVVSPGTVSSNGYSTLTFSNINALSSGTYSVVVTNSVGTTTTNFTVQVVGLPVFKTSLSNGFVGAGSNYTFSVTLTNVAASGVSYQWYYTDTNTSPMHVTNIAGATTNSLTVTGASATNTSPSLFYQVVATTAAGAVSNTVGLYIKNPPQISTQPTASLTLATNSTISLTAVLSAGYGQGTYYTWYKDGKAMAGKTGLAMTNTQTDITLTISSAVLTNSGVYSVVATNATGSATSSNSTVLVVAGSTIKTQPLSKFVKSGATNGFSLVVVMNGATNSAWNYQWYTNSGVALSNGTGSDGVIISGATNATLNVTNLAPSTNNYYVIVTNLVKTNVSATAVVTVLSGPSITSVQLTNVASGVTNALTDMTVTNIVPLGSSNVLNADATGSALRYQWYKGTAALSRKTNSSLIISKALATDSGTYTVRVSNKVASVTSSNIVLLVVAVPGIKTDIQGTNLIRGTNYTMTVVASNATSSALKYLWQRNGTTVKDWSASSTLTLTNVQPTTNGNYTVVLSNATTLTVTSRVATITVFDRLSISNQPTNMTLLVGGNYTNLVALSNGTYGTISYAWTKVGSTNSPGSTNTTDITNSLVFTNATTNGSGTYYVTISNAVGKLVSSNAFINFLTNPVFVTPLSNTAIAVGSNYTLRVSVWGATNTGLGLRYKWYHNSNVVQTVSSNAITLASATTNDSGTYTVIVTNALGLAATNVATLTVQAKAVIVTPPASVNVSNGLPFALSVVASGDGLVYQWRRTLKSGALTNIVDATNSTYSVDAASTNDAGSYLVVVSNLVSSATSTKAAVVVVYNKKSYKANASTVAVVGDYTGLFAATNGVPTYQSAGLLSLSVAASGAYSGKLHLEGDVINVSGQLTTNGTAETQITRSGKAPLTLKLVADDDEQQVTGSVSTTNWFSALTADLAVFNATNAAPWAGAYTLVIPATDPTNGLSGSGKVLVKSTGTITFAGTSSEGKAISQSTTVSKDGYWPFYLPYGNGEVIGWLQFVNGKPVGTLNWIDSTGENSTLSEAAGSSYSE
jgi:hypothetical protein